MITVKHNEYDRITFSLPSSMNSALDELKKETNYTKSEIIKMAIENYLKQEKQKKLKLAVDMMAKEYENNDALTEFTSLDGEDFIWNKVKFGK